MEVGREGCAPERRMRPTPAAPASCRHRVASKDHVHVHVHLPLHGPRLCGVLSVFDSWPRDHDHRARSEKVKFARRSLREPRKHVRSISASLRKSRARLRSELGRARCRLPRA